MKLALVLQIGAHEISIGVTDWCYRVGLMKSALVLQIGVTEWFYRLGFMKLALVLQIGVTEWCYRVVLQIGGS
jgi:hypothetical protein